MNDTPLFCDRCTAQLTPGDGNFYVVNIQAVADPTPPSFSDEELKADHRHNIERISAEISCLSEQELLDQVYRRLTLFLCTSCYQSWIENPTGS